MGWSFCKIIRNQNTYSLGFFFFSIELNFRIKLQEHLRFCIPLIMTFASDKQGAEEQVITIAFKWTPLFCVRMLSDSLDVFYATPHG